MVVGVGLVPTLYERRILYENDTIICFSHIYLIGVERRRFSDFRTGADDSQNPIYLHTRW